MRALLVTYVLLSSLLLSNAQLLTLEECPDLKPMDDFDIEQFLGIWYTMQSNNQHGSCIQNFFYRDANDDLMFAETKKVESLFLTDKYLYETVRIETGNKTAADMSMRPERLGLTKLSPVSLKVIDTDYDSYAVMMWCDRVSVFHLYLVSILTRNQTIPDETVTSKVYQQLRSANAEPSTLIDIKHDDCEETPETHPSLGSLFMELLLGDISFLTKNVTYRKASTKLQTIEKPQGRTTNKTTAVEIERTKTINRFLS